MTVPPYPGQPDPGRSNPYSPSAAGVPPYGQPAGQQPYPGPQGQPGGAGFGQQGPPGQPPYGHPGMNQPPMPQPPKRRRWLKIGVPVAVVVVGAVVALGVVGLQYVGWNAEVGDCLDVPEFSADAEDQPMKVDCADDKATVKVAVKLDDGTGSCPDGNYDEISYDGGAKFCLMINAKDGDCFANVTSPTAGYERVACTDPAAEVAIAKVADGTIDMEQACAEFDQVQGIYYSEPPTVMCLTPPKAV